MFFEALTRAARARIAIALGAGAIVLLGAALSA